MREVIPSVGDPEFVLEVCFSWWLTLGVGFVVVVVLGYLLEVEALVPSAFLDILPAYLIPDFGGDDHLVARLAP